METTEDGDHLFGAQFASIAALAPAGTGVMDGCAPTSSSGLVVSVASGTVTVAGERVSVSAGSTTLSAASAGYRYDLVYITSAGVISHATGTPVADPSTSGPAAVPSIPADSVPIAIIQVDPSQTTIPSNKITDCRALMTALAATNMYTDRIDARNYRSVDATSNLKLDLGDDGYSATEIVASFTVPPSLSEGSVLRIKATVTAGSSSGGTHQLLIKHGSDTLASGTVLDPTEVENFSETITVTGGWQIDFYMVIVGVTSTGTVNDKEVHCQMPDEFVEA